jgi:hypothetical protein
LKDDIDITWYEPIKATNDTKDEIIFWTNINELLKSDYVLLNETSANSFELGIIWTVNYIRKLLTRSGHKDAVRQLDKFELFDKNIIALNKGTNKTMYQIAIKDQGKIFKNTTAITNYIKDKEK